jgi:hypothetical protein
VWRKAERESIEEAFLYHAANQELTRGEIMGRFMEIRILDWKGLDTCRQSLGLKAYEMPEQETE